jgi:hypothetical protein
MTGAGSGRIVLSPNEGERVQFGGLGVRFMIEGARSGGTFALVEHPIEPRALAAPMHTTPTRTSTPTCSRVRSASRSGTRSSLAGRGSGLQAEGRPSRLLERGRRAGAGFGDHLPRRVRAVLRGGGRFVSSRPSRPARRAGARRGNGQVRARDRHELRPRSRGAPRPRLWRGARLSTQRRRITPGRAPARPRRACRARSSARCRREERARRRRCLRWSRGIPRAPRKLERPPLPPGPTRTRAPR